MAVIKNISKLVVPAYNKSAKDVIDYINAQAWIPTSADVGLVEYPGNFGSYLGTNGTTTDSILQVTINATALVIPATPPVGIPDELNGTPETSASNLITSPPGVVEDTVALVSLLIKVEIASATV